MKTETGEWWENGSFSPVDRALSAINQYCFVKHAAASVLVSIAFYVGIVLAFGVRLGISANYFVLIPILSFSLVFGFWGGLAAGSLGLPVNLLLFWVLGHVEYSPANKYIAELSGLFVGSAFGFLSDYFKKMMREMNRRAMLENELRRSVAEKDILLRELQHRVKNNLNLIKSLIQLQRNRSDDPSFREASALLLNRVYTVALAHDLLFIGDGVLADAGDEWIDIEKYFRAITENVTILFSETTMSVSVTIAPPKSRMDKKIALNLGLILNELAVNAVKHAFQDVEDPALDVRLLLSEGQGTLIVSDNGIGCPSIAKNTAGSKQNLGLTLIASIVNRLEGSVAWSSSKGLRFELSFPYAELP